MKRINQNLKFMTKKQMQSKDELLLRAIIALEEIALNQKRANKVLIAMLSTPMLNKFIFESENPDEINNFRLDLIKALKSK